MDYVCVHRVIIGVNPIYFSKYAILIASHVLAPARIAHPAHLIKRWTPPHVLVPAVIILSMMQRVGIV